MASQPSSSKIRKVQNEDNQPNAEGYIHNVTPIKISRNGYKYFNAQIQEKVDLTEMVCFVGEDVQRKMSDLAKDRTPVALKNISRSPSQRFTGKFDVKFDNRSTISTPVRKLDFEHQTLDSESPISVKDVKAAINPYQKTTIKIKLYDIGKTEDQQTKSRIVPKSECIVADNTGMIKCTFWDNDLKQLTLGQSYHIKDVAVRIFDGQKVLTTTPNSVITRITDIGPILEEELPNTTKNMEFEINSIKCSAVNNCRICNRNMGDFNVMLKTVKCPNCGMVQKTKAIIPMFKADLVISYQENTRRLQISDGAIKNHPMLANMTTTQQIEEFFMQQDTVKAEVSGNETTIIKLLE